MRKILFRGLHVESKSMVYGNLLNDRDDGIYICEGVGSSAIEVDPNTVGEFTGLTDRNGKEIFEGDKFKGDEEDEYYVVEYNDKQTRFEVSLYGRDMYHNQGGGEEFDSEISKIDTNCFDMDCLLEMQIIGNIHDKTNENA